jgi:hypothetical protein
MTCTGMHELRRSIESMRKPGIDPEYVLLNKPFDLNHLAHAIRESLLAAKQPAG